MFDKSYYTTRRVLIGFVVLQCLFYTWVSSQVGFLADDLRYIYEIHKGNTPLDFVLHPYTNIFAWRPVSDLSWVLNVIVSGAHSFPYHLFNVVIFAATLVVLFVVLRRVLSEKIALYALVLDHFGRYPQLMITLPAHSFVSHWKQLTLNSDASEPVDLLWNSTFNDQPAFNSIVVDPKATQELWLCAYPNWVVSGKLRTLSLAFSPNESTVTIHALTLHAEQ